MIKSYKTTKTFTEKLYTKISCNCTICNLFDIQHEYLIYGKVLLWHFSYVGTVLPLNWFTTLTTCLWRSQCIKVDQTSSIYYHINYYISTRGEAFWFKSSVKNKHCKLIDLEMYYWSLWSALIISQCYQIMVLNFFTVPFISIYNTLKLNQQKLLRWEH